MLIEPPQAVSLACPDVCYIHPVLEHLRLRRDLTVTRLAPDAVIAAAATHDHTCMLLPPTTLLDHGPFKLLPGVGVSAEGKTGSEHLLSPHELADIQSIHVPPSARHLETLVKILFLERGLPTPAFTAVTQETQQARLVCGNDGIAQQALPGHDLGTLWRECTGLPYVLGAWACRADAPYRRLRTMLGEACRDATPDERTSVHYRLLSEESESLRVLHALAIKHGIAEATGDAIAFC